MASALVHRGPDDGGVFLSHDGRVGLAHRRLAILDRAGGAQPFTTACGRVTIVFNGQVYNHLELGAGLPRRTRSDTEVLAEGIARDGAGFVERLRGMWAFAAYDRARGAVLLARDVAGIKPLYVRRDAQGLSFASEVGPLQPGPLDRAALVRFVLRGFLDDRTPWRDVERIEPGAIRWEDARRSEIVRAVAPLPPPTTTDFASGSDPREAFRALLEEAVRIRLQGDEPPAVLLSGGVDSAAIAALAARHVGRTHGRRLRTFTLGFDDPRFDERPYARRVAEHLDSDHTEVVWDPGSLRAYPALLDRFEEWTPVLPAAQALTTLFAAVHAAGERSVLTGQGADEVLDGYPWYEVEAARVLDPGETTEVRTARWWRYFASEIPIASERSWATMLFTPRLMRDLDPGAFAPPHAPDVGPTDTSPLVRLGRHERRTRLPCYLLHEIDRAAMISSVEARVPFLDRRLVDLCERLPDAWRARKRILRAVMAELLPAEIATRPKIGFLSAADAIFRAEQLPTFAERALSTEALASIGIFQPMVVRALVDKVRAGAAQWTGLLNRVLNVQLRLGA